jgi:hypothetical protein
MASDLPDTVDPDQSIQDMPLGSMAATTIEPTPNAGGERPREGHSRAGRGGRNASTGGRWYELAARWR